MEFEKRDNKKKILEELITKQLKNIDPERKLFNKDLRRIVKYIDTSIFDDDKCCKWNGYVTNEANSKRGTYVNFFFRNKKVALHRLLYENFVGILGDENYLKFSCDDSDNFGKCCNVNHMIKYKYNNQKDIKKNINENQKINKEYNKEDNNKENNDNIDNKDNIVNNKDNMVNNKDNMDNIELKKNKKSKSRIFINGDLTLAFD